MVVFGNQKYACLSCIRGHRSSSCDHRRRILLQVRKPGRRSQTDPQNRSVLVWEESGPDSKKLGKYKLMNVPDEGSKPMPVEEDDDESVVVTDKYVFVHVGNNLFRRELKPADIDAETPSEKSLGKSQLSQGSSLQPSLSPEQSSDSDPLCSSSMPSYPLHGEMSDLAHPLLPIQSQHSLHGQTLVPQPFNQQLEPKQEVPSVDTELNDFFASKQSAPLVIGPMEFQDTGRSTVLNEIGLTEQEASEIWPQQPTQPQQSFSYASQCILPGQCECGDGCECPDCYEHRRGRHTYCT